MAHAATGYYSEKLAAEKLRKVYAIATPRIRQYLDAEIHFVRERIRPTTGCWSSAADMAGF